MISKSVLNNRQISFCYRNIYILKDGQRFYSFYKNNYLIGEITFNVPFYENTCLVGDVNIIQPLGNLVQDLKYRKSSLCNKNDFFKEFIDFYCEKLYRKIYNKIYHYKKWFYKYKDLKFDKTCSFAPQQYDVYYKNKYAGYIRCRHGQLTFQDKPCGSKLLFHCYRSESSSNEQAYQILNTCAQKYLNYIKKL